MTTYPGRVTRDTPLPHPDDTPEDEDPMPSIRTTDALLFGLCLVLALILLALILATGVIFRRLKLLTRGLQAQGRLLGLRQTRPEVDPDPTPRSSPAVRPRLPKGGSATAPPAGFVRPMFDEVRRVVHGPCEGCGAVITRPINEAGPTPGLLCEACLEPTA